MASVRYPKRVVLNVAAVNLDAAVAVALAALRDRQRPQHRRLQPHDIRTIEAMPVVLHVCGSATQAGKETRPVVAAARLVFMLGEQVEEIRHDATSMWSRLPFSSATRSPSVISTS